ncbi:MAG: hypothetical protein M1830_000684 [Pleopsidium flavum]|nr:MAG: hypothetical protein M1830_000684 [Pleopsidium flavum]
MQFYTLAFIIGFAPLIIAQDASIRPGFPPCATQSNSVRAVLAALRKSSVTPLPTLPISSLYFQQPNLPPLHAEIITSSTQLCGPVGGVYNNYTLLHTNSTSCPTPSGTKYYPVPSSSPFQRQPIAVAQSFATAHDIFNLTDLNTSDPESTIVAACASRCDTYDGPTRCASFFVNLGIPYPPLPPLPSGQNQSQAQRWYCHAYDAPLRPADFELATVPDTYISPEAFNRACEGGSTTTAPSATSSTNSTSATGSPSLSTGRAARVQSGVWVVVVLGGGLGGLLVWF